MFTQYIHLRYEFRLREPQQLSMEEICRDIQLRTDKRHTPWEWNAAYGC